MRSLILVIGLGLVAFPVVVLAQSDVAITGSVSDTSRAPIGGVSVQAKNVETNAVYGGNSAR